MELEKTEEGNLVIVLEFPLYTRNLVYFPRTNARMHELQLEIAALSRLQK